ncbi:MAG: hypothetical protein R8G66_05435 [Cytophagales bacterium]|nr:hypothetical protein [Cytophagales bacterium]
MQKTATLFIFFCSLLHCATTTQGQMQLIYAHDEDGFKIEGSKEALIEAVRKGKQVRIGWKMGEGSKKAEHFADAQMVTILNGEVYAQIVPIIHQHTKPKRNNIVFRSGIGWTFIASTTGNNSTLIYDMSDGSALKSVPGIWGNQWFVRD